MDKINKILFVCGGTGGHIYPAVAIADYIKHNELAEDIFFVGTKAGLEKDILNKLNYRMEYIDIIGMPRKVCLRLFLFFWKFLKSLWMVFRILKKEKPDKIIGTGGYVSAPVIFLASIMGYSTYIHEQNAYPGMTNRIVSRFVQKVFVSYSASENFFSNKKKIFCFGNPIRESLLDEIDYNVHKKYGLTENLKVLFIFGGSRGALSINKAVIELIKEIEKKGSSINFQIILGTGRDKLIDFEKELSLISQKITLNKFFYYPYIDNIREFYSISNLLICRAGATTLSELAACGLPSILIPYPYATDQHQKENARVMEKEGAAVMLEEKNIKGKVLYNLVIDLINHPEKLKNMSEKSKKLGFNNSVFLIAREILKK